MGDSNGLRILFAGFISGPYIYIYIYVKGSLGRVVDVPNVNFHVLHFLYLWNLFLGR